jgi:hypothetical protein
MLLLLSFLRSVFGGNEQLAMNRTVATGSFVRWVQRDSGKAPYCRAAAECAILHLTEPGPIQKGVQFLLFCASQAANDW